MQTTRLPILRVCIPAKIHTHTKCVMCLLNILNNFEAETGYLLDIKFLCGKSNIDQARSMMATDFYNECKTGDSMIFIDSDHIFTINDIKLALAINGDVSCGIYPNSVGMPTAFFVDNDKFYAGLDNRVLYAGTGFMLIKYDTLKILAEYIAANGPAYANISQQYPKVIPFFKQLIVPSELNPNNEPDKHDWLGEDYSFCYTVRIKCGLTIKGFLTNSLGHEVPNIRIFYPECDATKKGALIDKFKPKNKQEDNKIIYYCGFSRAQFGFNTKNGGSEQAIFNTIEKYYSNYEVLVYGNVIPEKKRNITLIPTEQFKLNEDYNVVILWRGFGLNILPLVRANEIYIDLHDNTNPDLLPLNYLSKVKQIWFKSKWHRTIFSYVPDNLVLIRPNIISPIYYEVAKSLMSNKIMKVKYRICYTSCYTRGLLNILEKCWMLIKNKYPKAEFHICYGMDLIEDKDLINRLIELFKLPGIFHYGRLTNYESAMLKATSYIQLYLCTSLNSEIDCLAVRESALLDCTNVLFDAGVFSEREGIKVPNGDYNAAFEAVCSIFDKL
jgi:hypothetical protein